MEAVDKWCSRFDVDRRGTSGAQPQPRQAQIPGKTRPNFSCGSSCYKTHHILPLHAHTRFKVTWSSVFIRAGRVQTLQNIVLIQECLWCFRRLRRGSGQTSFSFLDFIWSAPLHQKKNNPSSDTVSEGLACLTSILECVQSFHRFSSSSSFTVSVHTQSCLANSTCRGTWVWSAVIILWGILDVDIYDIHTTS